MRPRPAPSAGPVRPAPALAGAQAPSSLLARGPRGAAGGGAPRYGAWRLSRWTWPRALGVWRGLLNMKTSGAAVGGEVDRLPRSGKVSEAEQFTVFTGSFFEGRVRSHAWRSPGGGA